jgi:hypothetical protein
MRNQKSKSGLVQVQAGARAVVVQLFPALTTQRSSIHCLEKQKRYASCISGRTNSKSGTDNMDQHKMRVDWCIEFEREVHQRSRRFLEKGSIGYSLARKVHKCS